MSRLLSFVALAVLAAACQSARTESDLFALEDAIGRGRTARIGELRIGSASALEGPQVLWIHRQERNVGNPREDRQELFAEIPPEQVARAVEDQLRASGFEVVAEKDPADLLIDAELLVLELRTEISGFTGPDGRRAAVATLRFALRRGGDSGLVARGEETAWTVFSGAQVVFDPQRGARRFEGKEPEPCYYAVRFALLQFLESVVSDQ
ncbi:MAG: hypothetical protein HY720_22220 [Planctomycetes bacterium]|nr:hypothetical protein [Planctomycetota bacterium]